MANIFEYVLSLKDQTSKTLAVIGINSDKALNKFASLEKQAKDVAVNMKIFGGSVGALKEKLALLKNERDWIPAKEIKSIRAYNSEINKLTAQISKLETINGSKLKTWRQDFANSLPGANMIRNPLAISGAVLTGVWGATQRAMDADKTKMTLQTMTSDAIGEKLFGDLTKFATDTVFGTELYEQAQQMLANGIKDTDIMPVMKQLGDISMGDSNKLGQLSLAFAQINGKGHLAGQELLQLINAGFNPLQVISEKTGESMGSLTDKMSKGQISIADVRKAMEMATGPTGRFNGMLEKIANTPAGKLEQLKGQFDQMVVTLGQAFMPVASGIMSFFSFLGEALGPLLKPIGVVFASLAAGLLIATTAQWAFNAAVWKNPYTWIIAGVVLLITVIYKAIQKFDEWGATVLIFMGPLGRVISMLKHLYDHWQSIKDAFQTDGIIAGFKRLGMVLLDVLLKPMQQILEMIKNWPIIGDSATKALDTLKGFRERNNLMSVGEIEAKRASDPNRGTPVFAWKSANPLEPISPFSYEHLKGALTPSPTSNNTTGAKDAQTTKDNNSIATGGTKNTTIHITIGKQIETLTVMSNNIKEGAQKIRDIIVEEMTRAAAMAGALAS